MVLRNLKQRMPNPTGWRRPSVRRSPRKIVILGRGQHGLSGLGKMKPKAFLRPFSQAAEKLGIPVVVSHSAPAANSEIEGPQTAVLNVFNELQHRDSIVIGDDQLTKHTAFNALWLRNVLGDKRRMVDFYRAHRVPVPSDSEVGKPGFRIVANGTQIAAQFIEGLEESEDGYLVTKLIDTRRSYKGRAYRCYIRVFAVGPHVICANVGARHWAESEIGVHLADTPLDPGLINHLHEELVVQHERELAEITSRIGLGLGPGFFAHDLVVETETDRIFVCETGIKFELGAPRKSFRPLYPHVASLAVHEEEYFDRAVRAVICCMQDAGGWNGT